MGSGFIPRKGRPNRVSKKLPKGLRHNPIFRFPKDQKCFCTRAKKTNKTFKECCHPRMPRFVTELEARGLEVALKEVGI